MKNNRVVSILQKGVKSPTVFSTDGGNYHFILNVKKKRGISVSKNTIVKCLLQSGKSLIGNPGHCRYRPGQIQNLVQYNKSSLIWSLQCEVTASGGKHCDLYCTCMGIVSLHNLHSDSLWQRHSFTIGTMYKPLLSFKNMYIILVVVMRWSTWREPMLIQRRADSLVFQKLFVTFRIEY